MKFSDIPWHKCIADSLRHLADSGQIPHAILLGGPSGTGKMLMARTFAQYVHCRSPRDGEPCGVCPDCRQHQSFNHPDTHFIYPVFKKDSNHQAVAADYIAQWKDFLREHPYMEPELWPSALGSEGKQVMIYTFESEAILRKASVTAFSSEKKIFLIWQPEKMNAEAANKLLKILEEPFADTIFILVSDAPEELLPTIRSRVSYIFMPPPSTDTIADWLVSSHGVDTEQAEYAARMAEGNVTKALDFEGQRGEKDEFGELFRDMMRRAWQRDVAALKEISEKIAEMKREKSIRFLAYCSRMLRENFVYNFGEPSLVRLSPDEEAFSSRFARFVNIVNIGALEREFSKATADIARNANGKIVALDLLLRLMSLLRQGAAAYVS